MGLLLIGLQSSEVHLSEHQGNTIQTPSSQQKFILQLWRKESPVMQPVKISMCQIHIPNLNGESSSGRSSHGVPVQQQAQQSCPQEEPCYTGQKLTLHQKWLTK